MRIVNFGQLVDVVDGGLRIRHQLTVELPSGRPCSIHTDELTIQQLVNAATEDNEASDEIHDGIYDTPSADYLVEDSVLDEDEDEDEEFPEVVMGTLAQEPLEADPPKGGLGQPKRPQVDSDGFYLPIPAKTVPKDEMGYPIVQAGQPVTMAEDEEEGDGTQI